MMAIVSVHPVLDLTWTMSVKDVYQKKEWKLTIEDDVYVILTKDSLLMSVADVFVQLNLDIPWT